MKFLCRYGRFFDINKGMVLPRNPQEIIGEMVDRIVTHMAPEKVILFGSHARGEAGPDSDADFLIVFPSISSKRKMAVKIHALLGGMGLAKDILVVSSSEWEALKDVPGSIVRPATLEGRVLYDRAA